jgi:dihydrofolate reductase
MPKLFFEITTSLDGFVTGPDPRPDEPLGTSGERLHEWALRLRSWRESHGRSGGAEGLDSELMQESIDRSGAVVMGRGMFGGGPGDWGDEPWEGWWGDEPPFRKPVFVLTHHEREPLVKGETTFTFVTDGIESALEQAKAAAGDMDVSLAGGADVFQQYLKAGLVDELLIHVAPLVLGSGTRLFADGAPGDVELEQTRSLSSDIVTHLGYRVMR